MTRGNGGPYLTLFEGVALTALGSGYYHLAPDNARLVWDRLPMTIGFMGLLAAVLAERVSVPVARRLFVPLLASVRRASGTGIGASCAGLVICASTCWCSSARSPW